MVATIFSLKLNAIVPELCLFTLTNLGNFTWNKNEKLLFAITDHFNYFITFILKRYYFALTRNKSFPRVIFYLN